MKILLITPEFPPIYIGGGGVVFRNLSKQLQQSGHQVSVLAGNFHNRSILGKVTVCRFDGVEVTFIPLLPSPKSNNFDLSSYTPPSPKGVLKVLKTIVSGKADLIHLHGSCHPLIDLAAVSCMLLRKKYVLTSHGIPKAPESQKFFMRSFFKIYLSTLERAVTSRAFAFTVVSKTLKAECEAKNLTNSNTIVIPNGSEDGESQPTPKSISNIEQKYALANKTVIFSIGRLHSSKGFQYLIEAMQTVTIKVPSAVAVVAGTGPYGTFLAESINKKGLSGKVHLVGWVDEESKVALYARSDTVVFPSVHETFGLVLLEACRMHKPIIAFDSGSASELLEETGLLVPTGNSQELADAIVNVITDTALRERIIERTSKSKTLDWTEVARRYMQVYSKQSANQMGGNKKPPSE
jgi:glycosyltransferase involved in cell wall biosynthesis